MNPAEQRLAETLARRSTPEFKEAGDRLLEVRKAEAKAKREAAQHRRSMASLAHARRAIKDAETDVRRDNPDIEPGWEINVFRSVLSGYDRKVQDEIFRTEFAIDFGGNPLH